MITSIDNKELNTIKKQDCEHDLNTLIEGECEYCAICGLLVKNNVKKQKNER